jgi:DNA-binding SARP family transcriptional activator
MTLEICLLGVPRIVRDGVAIDPPRGNKPWALLAYLILGDGNKSRSRLSELLWSEADDPRAALRWSLVELRRALEAGDALGGDPLAFLAHPGTRIDVDTLISGLTIRDEDDSTSGELLGEMSFPSAPEFEVWLTVERAYLGGLRQSSLREQALASRAAGEHAEATALARRAVAVDPLDQGCQELLLRCLERSEGTRAAEAHLKGCGTLLRRELGVEPGPELSRAARGASTPPNGIADDPGLARDQLQAGLAAIDAGAVEPGIQCLRLACSQVETGDDEALRATCLTELGTALVHALRGRDEEGSAILHEALAAAEAVGERPTAVSAMRELGYVDVQAGRNASAGRWLAQALRLSEGDGERASVLALRGMLLSDRAHYEAALRLLEESVGCAERSGGARQAAFSLSLIGRIHLLRDDLGPAAAAVEGSRSIAVDEHWQSFLPWPETLEGEIAIRQGEQDKAEQILNHSFALSCTLADPCWEGAAARATALLHFSRGDAGAARDWLADARVRVARVADPYQWMHGYVLDASAELAVLTSSAQARETTRTLQDLAAVSGMREFTVRAYALRARLGDRGAMGAALTLASSIDNPVLERMLAESEPKGFELLGTELQKVGE